MALVRKTTVNKAEILRNGVMMIQLALEVVDDIDDEILNSRYHRFMLVPGDDVATRFAEVNAVLLANHKATAVPNAQINRVNQVANVIWTPAVIAAYQALVAAANSEE